MVRRPLAIAFVLRDVVAANDLRPMKRRCEDRRRSRMTKVLERLARRTGQRVQRELLALLIDDVVEERAEARAGHLGRGVGDRLHDLFEIELRHQRVADAVERFDLARARVLLRG